MSLINDALRRAQQSHPAPTTPAAGPVLKPADTSNSQNLRNTLLLAVLTGTVIFSGVILLWEWSRRDAGVRARTKSSETPAVTRPVAASVTPSVAISTPAPSIPETAAPAATDPVTNAAPVVAQVQTYKLQGILYRPKSPSAVINDKMVFPGSRVGDARVVSINAESVTIVTDAGQTNLLELPY